MLSVPHLIIIFIVALAVLGPEKLPQVARTLGKAMADFRRVTGDFRYQIENEMREMDRQARLKELEASMAAPPVAPAPEGTVPAAPLAPYETAETSAYEAPASPSEPAASATPQPVAPEPPPAELAPASSQKLGDAHSS